MFKTALLVLLLLMTQFPGKKVAYSSIHQSLFLAGSRDMDYSGVTVLGHNNRLDRKYKALENYNSDNGDEDDENIDVNDDNDGDSDVHGGNHKAIEVFFKHLKIIRLHGLKGSGPERSRNLKWGHIVAESPFDEKTQADAFSTFDLLSRAQDFLRDFQVELRHRKHVMATSEWNFLTNLTDRNARELETEQTKFSQWWKRRARILQRLRSETLPSSMLRQIGMALTLSLTSTNDIILQAISSLQSDLINTYSTSRVCVGRRGDGNALTSSCMELDPGLVDWMAKSRDPTLLQEVWVKWRDVTGAWMKGRYFDLVTLMNKMARENGYSDYSQFETQQAFFETPNLEALQAQLWKDITPFYLHFHAYVRRKLREAYGRGVIGDDGTIPAHLFGNMWAQNWVEIYDLVAPYSEVDVFGDVDAMLSSHGDARMMYSLAEEFYTTLGLPPMTRTFWEKSIFTKGRDRRIDCNARTFDMFSHSDFRIKSCIKPNLRSLLVAFHEMGHIAYCMGYAHQPTVYRTGASLATHEAIGNLIQLALMSSPGRLCGVVGRLVERVEGREKKRRAEYGRSERSKVKEEEEKDIRREEWEEEEIDRKNEKGKKWQRLSKIYEGLARNSKKSGEIRNVSVQTGRFNEKQLDFQKNRFVTEGDDTEENHYDNDEGDNGDEKFLGSDNQATLNRLMFQALEKVAFLPFGYLVDRWRYEVMAGDVTPDVYNKRWWQLRLQYQGIRSPTPRSESDFDPGAKYHVIANSMFSGYFIAQFQQFQMFSALCPGSKRHSPHSNWNNTHNKPHEYSSFKDGQPLHLCDISRSQGVTDKLRRFLGYGSSVQWQRQLEELTGENTVTSDAFLTYFHPLYQWLKRENAKSGEAIGWEAAEINWRD